MDNGFTESWSSQTNGNIDANVFTCVDPAILSTDGQPASATFFVQAFASTIDLTPGSGMGILAGGSASVNGEYVGDFWSSLTDTVTIQEQETFVATGGSGQGFVEGDVMGAVDNTGPGGLSGSFGPMACIGGGAGAYAPVAFTFGQAFTVSVTSTVGYSFNPPNGAGCGYDTINNGVFDANGNSISGVQFNEVATPEPAGLTALGMLLLVPMVWRRKRG